MMTKITDLYFGSGRNRRREEQKPAEPVPASEGGVAEEKKESPAPTRGIKIMRTDDTVGDKYFENPEGYLSINIDHVPQEQLETLYKHRLSEADKDRVTKLFNMFLGTRKYHNFSKDVKPHQTTAMRYMIELKANDFMYINRDTLDVTDESDPNAI